MGLFSITEVYLTCFISIQAEEAFDRDAVDEVNVTEVEIILDKLEVVTTSNSNTSQLPRSLDTTNSVLNKTVNFLMEGLKSPEVQVPLSVVSLYTITISGCLFL